MAPEEHNGPDFHYKVHWRPVSDDNNNGDGGDSGDDNGDGNGGDSGDDNGDSNGDGDDSGDKNDEASDTTHSEDHEEATHDDDNHDNNGWHTIVIDDWEKVSHLTQVCNVCQQSH